MVPAVRRALLWGGAAGPVLFTAVYTVEGVLRPGYDNVRRPISDLSLGPGGWVQVADFVTLGILVLGLAVALGSLPARPSSSAWVPPLLALFGFGLIAAGVFVTDPAPGYPPESTGSGVTVHGTLHQAASLVAFNALPVACYVTAWRVWRTRAGAAWAVYSLASGVLMMASLAGFGIAMAAGGPAGVFERCAGSIGLAWLALTAARAASPTVDATRGSPPA